MIEEAAWELLPKELPAEVEPWVLHSAREAQFDGRQFRAYVWANWLLDQARFPGPTVHTAALGSVSGDYEITDITAGFIPVISNQTQRVTKREMYLQYIQNEARKVKSNELPNLTWTFGIMIRVQPAKGRSLTPFVEQKEISQLTWVDGYPVMCEVRESPSTVEEQAPVNPQGAATSTCFVKPVKGKRFYGPVWSEGILIARHVLGAAPTAGALVNMQTGPALPVVDIDSKATTIDAAVLDAGIGSVPASAKQISVYSAVAPGTNVTVYGANGLFTADVLRIMDDPNYFGNMVTHRAFLDQYGRHGDSGALVRTTTSQDALGVYIGHTQGPPAEGLVQLMRQVTKYFEVDLYE